MSGVSSSRHGDEMMTDEAKRKNQYGFVTSDAFLCFHAFILPEKQTHRTNHGTVIISGVTTEFVKSLLLLVRAMFSVVLSSLDFIAVTNSYIVR